MAFQSLVFGALAVMLTILIVYGMWRAGRMAVTRSRMFLPGSRMERYTVLLVATAGMVVLVSNVSLNAMELGVFVFLGGLMTILAYRWDEATEIVD